MGFATFTFFVVFLLIASGGLLLFYREAMVQRLSAVVTPRAKESGFLGGIRQMGFSLRNAIERLERFLPKSKAEVSVTERRMVCAGYRSESAINAFYGAKVLVPLALLLLVTFTGVARYSPFFVYILAAALGFLAPDFWLGRRIANRQAQIRRGLPDTLDLLVICIEAGQSMDQATTRTAAELRLAQPAISDELGMVMLEQRAGRPRAEAWRRFADRTDVESVRNLVAVLVQSEQFGTSVAKTLRIHSDTLRVQRRQKVEEQAAKTSVKLVFPLVFFIFPSLFLVTVGPAIIIMAASFQRYLTH